MTPAGCTYDGLVVAEQREPAALTTLLPEWWALWRADPRATPFQSPAWLVPWWRHRSGAPLLLLTVRTGRDGRLVGLLPLFRWDSPHGPRLVPLGAGISDYLDGLFADGYGPAAAVAILARLAGDPADDAALLLDQLRPESPLATAAAPPGWREQCRDACPCPVLELPAPPADWTSALSRSMRQNLRTYRHRLDRVGRARFVRAEPGSVAAALDVLFELHAARWRERGEAGMLADAGVAAFHREAAPAMAEAGLLRLHLLLLDERPIAAAYGFAAKNATFYYLGGFAPELAALGPGTLVVGHMIAEAAAEGARTFDFLRGRELYKYRWGAADRPALCRMLSPPGS